ncbi:GLPGLI family protein [Neolewinella xylanilytica]|uniref:GLPGLI family protein n=1 Tax=Neolewinella xylanilytica TaxID=1514080 RepID=A0A2S6I571_9BACT|nr:GLPGLI family protein [Neolewinella xylanilytica]PPK86324.1 GLPGLI family protein [Neolewinella xylanilytica]
MPLKTICFTVILAFSSPLVRAQITHGTIDYLEHRDIEIWDGMSLDDKKRMEKLKEEGAFDRTGRLTFNDQAFSYQQVEEERDPNDRRGWMGRQTENPDIYYTSLQDSLVTDQRQIMDRTFIMEDKWLKPEWEIPENQRANMAYTLPSKLAFAVSPEGDTLTAYFTESIPLGIGPQGYGGLPGAIVYLKVENEGSFTEYTMKTMQPNPGELSLKKPSEGDKISREKFEKVAEKRREVMERRQRGWERQW